MKDLKTDDALSEKLTELSKEILGTVIVEVDHCDEAEFVLSFCRDYVLGHLEGQDQGERWFRKQKRELVNGEKTSKTEETDEERMARLQGVFHRVMTLMEQLTCAEDAYFVLSSCRNAVRDVFQITPDAMEVAEKAAACIGKQVSDMATANMLADKRARHGLERT